MATNQPTKTEYKEALVALKNMLADKGAHIRDPYAMGDRGLRPSWGSAYNPDEGPSVTGALKSFGSTALNTLSVPQAVAFTLASKTLEGMGVEGHGAMDWSDMAGGFSDDYKGASELLGQLGMDEGALRTYLGLGADILADPLWLVAPAKVAASAGKAGKAAGKVVEDAADAAKATDTATGGVSAAEKAAGYSTGTSPAELAARQARGPAYSTGTSPAELAARPSRGAADATGTSPADLAAQTARAAAERAYSAGTPPSEARTISDALRDAFSTGVSPKKMKAQNNARASTRKRTLNRKRKEELMRVRLLLDIEPRLALTKEQKVDLAKALTGFKSKAVKKGKADGPTVAPATKATPAVVGGSPEKARKSMAEALAGLARTGAIPDASKVNPKALNDVFDKVIDYAKTQRSAPNQNIGIRLGVGKYGKGAAGRKGKTYIELDTGIRYPARTLSAIGPLRAITQAPIEQAVSSMRRTERESSAFFAKMLMTLKEENKITDDQSVLLTLAASLRSLRLAVDDAASAADIDNVIAKIKSSPHWAGAENPKVLDDLLDEMATRWGDWRSATGKSRSGELYYDDTYSPQMLSEAHRVKLREEFERRAGMAAGRASNLGDEPIKDMERTFGSIFNYYTKDDFTNLLRANNLVPEGEVDNLVDAVDNLLRQQDSAIDLGALNRKADARRDRDAARMGGEPEPYFGFRSERKTFKDGIPYDPELDFFRLATARDSAAQTELLRQKVTELFDSSGFIKAPRNPDGSIDFTEAPTALPIKEVIDDVLSRKGKRLSDDAARKRANQMLEMYDRAMYLHVLKNSDTKGFTEKMMRATSMMKVLYTAVWPAHYVNNMMGDLFNSMIEGSPLQSFRNFGTNFLVASKPGKEGLRTGNKFAKLSAYDAQQMQRPINEFVTNEATLKTLKAAGVNTGADLLALSHMSGLGRGLIGENVADLYSDLGRAVKMFEATKNPIKQYFRFMQRQNIAREDAIRFKTWVSHMEKGNDAITAAAKTIEGIFDYGSMTRFEKVWLRNILMFYSWMRLNTPFQVRGLVKKPGLYSAVGDIERDRPKMPNEPDYISDLGGIAIPGIGLVTFGAPWADLYKLPTPFPGAVASDQSPLDTGRDLLSSLNPLAKVPLELTMNQNVFTGSPIQKYEGQLKAPKTPFLGALLNNLGVGEPATQRKDGPPMPSVNPKLAAFFDNLAGPFGSNANRFMNPDQDQNVTGPLDLLMFLGGIKRTEPQPDWERQAAIRAASRKAAETRRKNSTKGND